MNFMTCSPIWTPASESYWTPSLKSMRANPITPRPIFRLSLVHFSIAAIGYLFMSMTLSRKCTEVRMDRSRCAQSISYRPSAVWVMVLQIDAPEVARLVGQQRLLAARVGGLDHRVV